MATSGSFYTTYYSTRRIKFEWTLDSQSIADNTSTISYKFRGSGDNDGAWYYCKNGYLNINGDRVWTQGSDSKIQLYYGTVLKSGTITLKHNTDGTCSFSADGGATIYNYGTYQTGSGSWTLPQIPRAASLTAAPNFTDEENPTITYSNPAGAAVESLQACIATADGSATYAAYRDIPTDGTSYTFNLTDAERNALRWGTINSNTLTVKFYVKTVIGGNTYYSTLDKILTIVNANPTITATAKDTGGYSTPLTGNNQTIIKGFNYVAVDAAATAYKGSSIKSYTITNGATVLTTNSGGFENVEDPNFVFTATDSRGNTVSKTITLGFIDYIKLTCNLKANNPTAEGEMALKISGNYFNGSFGKVSNTLNIYFRYKENDGEYGEWIAAQEEPILSEGTYSVDINLTGLNYQSAYTFQAKAADKIYSEVLSVEKRVKSIPVFDWGENDFQFNVDVYDKSGAKLGAEMTAADFSATLSSGKALLESGWVAITPTANAPTTVYVNFKHHYNKVPVVIPAASSGVIGTQVLGVSTNGITNDGVNIVLTRTNTTPTTIHYFVFGEVEE